jgi:hypothetical protein
LQIGPMAGYAFEGSKPRFVKEGDLVIERQNHGRSIISQGLSCQKRNRLSAMMKV